MPRKERLKESIWFRNEMKTATKRMVRDLDRILEDAFNKGIATEMHVVKLTHHQYLNRKSGSCVLRAQLNALRYKRMKAIAESSRGVK